MVFLLLIDQIEHLLNQPNIEKYKKFTAFNLFSFRLCALSISFGKYMIIFVDVNFCFSKNNKKKNVFPSCMILSRFSLKFYLLHLIKS